MKRMKLGRPTKLTPEVAEKILTAIRAGNYMETAAAYAGIHKDTLYEWLKKGNTGFTNEYREFSDAVQKALADAEMKDVEMIGNAASFQWQAAAWRLERKFPDRWGRKDTHRVDASIGGKTDEPVEVEVKGGAAVLEMLKRLAGE